MSRKWTARKATTLNEAALDPARFTRALTVVRADPTDPKAALKQTLGLIVSIICLVLPLHLAVCWLASVSVLLAGTVGLVASLVLLGIALARYLGQDDLLQKLPLVMVVVLIGYGLTLLLAAPPQKAGWVGGWGGGEVLGTVFLVIAVASILGSFYQPMSVAYRSVTQNSSAQQLMAASAVLCLSTVLAVVSQLLPPFLLTLIMNAVVGAYAGLVLFEYAAWAKANPAVSLEHAQAFNTPPGEGCAVDTDLVTLSPRRGRSVLFQATVFGLSFGTFGAITVGLVTQDDDLRQFFLRSTNGSLEAAREAISVLWMLSVIGLVYGFAATSNSLDGLRVPKDLTSLTHGWQTFVVFLTYPDTKHPLAHQFRFRWLRPTAVRTGLSVAVILIVATTNIRPAAKPASPQAKTPSVPAPVQPVLPAPSVGSRDQFVEAIVGFEPGDNPAPRSNFLPPPVVREPAATTPEPTSSSGVLRMTSDVPLFLFGPPVLIYMVVSLLGTAIIPAYRSHFETPAVPPSGQPSEPPTGQPPEQPVGRPSTS